MAQREEKQFFDIVKQDDLISFCARLKDDEKLIKASFGRFPLLSTLYLFDCKKILKKYEKELLSINDFVVLNEPFELYKKFKDKSEKSLRLYGGKKEFVMPIEMLAILHKDRKVKSMYKALENEQKTQDNLSKIYTLNEQKIDFDCKKIKISANPKKVKRTKTVSLISTPIVILLVCFFLYAGLVGIGTTLFPKHINSYSEFSSLSSKSIAMSLENDIVIDGQEIEELVGTIDAKGHTITIKNNKSLFNKISGTLKNAKIVFECEDLTLSESFGILTNLNEGTIENVKLLYNGNVSFVEKNLSFCGFSTKNNGSILNCIAEFNTEVTSTVEGDAFFAAFVYENDGAINGCKVLSGDISANNTDLSGIVVKNNESAVISECVNNAKISQDVDIKDWSPTVAGVALTNYGKIKNCVNNGEINVSDLIDETTNSYILVGGVCAVNYSEIYHCKNACDIVVTSKKNQVFAGGICAQTIASTQVDAGIEACGVSGTISVEKDDDVDAFCGGIAGLLQGVVGQDEEGQSYTNGYIFDCFETCEFLQSFNNETRNFNGLMIGLVLGRNLGLRISLYVKMQNDYCLLVENASSEIAVVYAGNMYYSPITLDSRFIVNSVDEISNYW